MARILAVEWDTREARVAAVQTRGGRVALEHAFAVPLGDKPDADAAAQVGAKIRAALAERRIGRGATLVAVGRASIELKQLSLPPAPDDELPDLVRFQAQREFNSLDDAWPLDFVPLGNDPTAPRQVLAAAISPDLVKNIQGTCAAAELRPTRMVLRPCATASLLCRRRPPEPDAARLLVDLLADEADLTVLVGSQVVFLRTVRLPTDVPDEIRPLLSEIRRTIGAAQNQLGGRKVEGIDLCGRGGEHAVLAQRIAADIGLPVAPFDPLADLELEPGLAADLPEHPGRFAPLVGMLVDEASNKRPAIDFLQPRRRPEAASRRPTYVRIAVGAALTVLAAGVGIWIQLDGLDAEIAKLSGDVATADRELKDAKEVEKKFKPLDAWATGEINWLDELEELAVESPSSQDAMLTKLTIKRPVRGGGGEIDIQVLVKDPASMASFETGLGDEHHKVKSKTSKLDGKRAPYLWSTGATIVVSPQEKAHYQKRAAGRAPPAKTPPAEAPPAVTPPAVTPPAVTPLAETPPAEAPPAAVPPAGAAPVPPAKDAAETPAPSTKG